MKVEQMINTRGNGAMNQFVITDGERIVFQSYQSTIIEIDNNKMIVKVFPDYNYSRTTGKHRNIFFSDYTRLTGLNTLKELEKAMKAGTYNGYTIETVKDIY
jgi:hypothetical protein